MNLEKEVAGRVEFIRNLLAKSGANGVVFGNSGGKDSALVGILCKMACDNTVGVLMPCSSKRNYTIDLDDGAKVADKFGIEKRIISLTEVKEKVMEVVGEITTLNDIAISNIAPRLRMISLYAIAASENRLVAGTGNRSEVYMGYFTKWGDGGHDFNPIADLTVKEIYAMLEYLGAPREVIEKSPSAGLFEGQTDEQEMGVTYEAIDNFLLNGEVDAESKKIIDRYHSRSEHKRSMPSQYKNI